MKRVLAVVAVAILCVACSHDDMPDVPATDAVTDTPIALRVGVAEETTRAGYPAGKLTEGTMGFYMTTAGANHQDTRYNAANRQLECRNGKWGAVGYPLLWRNATDEVSWQAYYPYSEENISDGIMTVSIPADQNKDGVYDLLYAQGSTTGAESSNGIQVKLKHMFAKLVINLIPSNGMGNIEVDSVILNDLTIEARFNISNTEQLIIPGNMIDYSDEEVNINMIKVDDTTFESIVLPYNPSILGVEIILKGGRKFYYTRGFTEFEKGHVQTLNIQVGRDKIETAQMAIAKWK